MYKSRTKADLIIEVWEELDCESVGAAEITTIEEAVRERFGPAAVESPMVIARLLADEGAELRHSEIMELFIERRSDLPYDAVFRNIINLTDFKTALASIRNLENLRRKLAADGDKEGLRLLREKVVHAKNGVAAAAHAARHASAKRSEHAEIAQWLTIWLQSPEVFENWIKLRRNSPDFSAKFGSLLN